MGEGLEERSDRPMGGGDMLLDGALTLFFALLLLPLRRLDALLFRGAIAEYGEGAGKFANLVLAPLERDILHQVTPCDCPHDIGNHRHRTGDTPADEHHPQKAHSDQHPLPAAPLITFLTARP